MITVAIYKNGGLLVGKSAVNTGLTSKKTGATAYTLDSGECIWHEPSDGAVNLAKKMLSRIKNDENNMKEVRKNGIEYLEPGK